MNHYTTIEQSKHLLELRLKPETADLLHLNNVGRFGKVDGTNCTTILKKNFNSLAEIPEIIPCWSTGALLELISSIRIEDEDIPRTMLWVTYDGWSIDWRISNIYYNESGKTPIEACYNMIVWLLQNNYIKTE